MPIAGLRPDRGREGLVLVRTPGWGVIGYTSVRLYLVFDAVSVYVRFWQVQVLTKQLRRSNVTMAGGDPRHAAPHAHSIHDLVILSVKDVMRAISMRVVKTTKRL